MKGVEANIPDKWDQINIVDQAIQDLLPDTEPPLEQKIGEVVSSFHRLNRYEQRALSRRKFAIRRLHQIDG